MTRLTGRPGSTTRQFPVLTEGQEADNDEYSLAEGVGGGYW